MGSGSLCFYFVTHKPGVLDTIGHAYRHPMYFFVISICGFLLFRLLQNSSFFLTIPSLSPSSSFLYPHLVFFFLPFFHSILFHNSHLGWFEFFCFTIFFYLTRELCIYVLQAKKFPVLYSLAWDEEEGVGRDATHSPAPLEADMRVQPVLDNIHNLKRSDNIDFFFQV